MLRSPNVSTARVADRILGASPYTTLSTTAIDNFSRWLLITDPPDRRPAP